MIDDDIFEDGSNGRIGDIFVICDYGRGSFITIYSIKNCTYIKRVFMIPNMIRAQLA
jgi:hypothetical protein